MVDISNDKELKVFFEKYSQAYKQGDKEKVKTLESMFVGRYIQAFML